MSEKSGQAKHAQAYRERIQGTAKQQQSKLVRSEKKLTHARDGGFPTPTSAGKKTRKDEAWVTAERRRLDMPALTEEEKAKRGWRPAAARLSLPFSPPAAAAAAAADDSEEDTLELVAEEHHGTLSSLQVDTLGRAGLAREQEHPEQPEPTQPEPTQQQQQQQQQEQEQQQQQEEQPPEEPASPHRLRVLVPETPEQPEQQPEQQQEEEQQQEHRSRVLVLETPEQHEQQEQQEEQEQHEQQQHEQQHEQQPAKVANHFALPRDPISSDDVSLGVRFPTLTCSHSPCPCPAPSLSLHALTAGPANSSSPGKFPQKQTTRSSQMDGFESGAPDKAACTQSPQGVRARQGGHEADRGAQRGDTGWVS
jgi:hypothetical protein